MKLHELKIKCEYAQAKLAGRKLFEIRLNDREYQVGDVVHYTCIDNNCVDDLLKEKFYKIIYISDYMQQENYVVYAEKEIKEVK